MFEEGIRGIVVDCVIEAFLGEEPVSPVELKAGEAILKSLNMSLDEFATLLLNTGWLLISAFL